MASVNPFIISSHCCQRQILPTVAPLPFPLNAPRLRPRVACDGDKAASAGCWAPFPSSVYENHNLKDSAVKTAEEVLFGPTRGPDLIAQPQPSPPATSPPCLHRRAAVRTWLMWKGEEMTECRGRAWGGQPEHHLKPGQKKNKTQGSGHRTGLNGGIYRNHTPPTPTHPTNKNCGGSGLEVTHLTAKCSCRKSSRTPNGL